MFFDTFYTSDITEAWNQAGNSSSGVVIKDGSSFIPLFFAFPAAILVCFTHKELGKHQ